MANSHITLRSDAQRNRQKVLAAAEEILSKQGKAASMRMIAKAADVGLATIYRQFPTKEALLRAVQTARVQRLLDYIQEAQKSDHAGEALLAFFDFAVEQATGEKIFAELLAQVGDNSQGHVVDFYRQLESDTAQLLARAQAEGSIRKTVTMEEFLALITATCLAADQKQWSKDLRTRTLNIIFTGLRSARHGSHDDSLGSSGRP